MRTPVLRRAATNLAAASPTFATILTGAPPAQATGCTATWFYAKPHTCTRTF
ncbi:hypothetical protein [Lentzea albidocapillata]|uniref:Uncharacterized protein n=1 Tax=Lentzea albidocapillata TaxID=40571 RepID=A0A1W2FSI3_9PSEU|nr:hypothetical protein [Lentzea albidocapillata]SMD24586.1 hypothetical protein SAMN05660733_07750 [Lentzea albidocapillata]